MGTIGQKNCFIIIPDSSEKIHLPTVKYKIVEEEGVLSKNAKGWRKELNVVSWNGAVPKYDIRDWAPECEKMGIFMI